MGFYGKQFISCTTSYSQTNFLEKAPFIYRSKTYRHDKKNLEREVLFKKNEHQSTYSDDISISDNRCLTLGVNV